MESEGRVGLPPAYEDADVDSLAQLMGPSIFLLFLVAIVAKTHPCLTPQSAHVRTPYVN